MSTAQNGVIKRGSINVERSQHSIRNILGNFRRSTAHIQRLQGRDRQIMQLSKVLVDNKVRTVEIQNGLEDLAFQKRIIGHKLVYLN